MIADNVDWGHIIVFNEVPDDDIESSIPLVKTVNLKARRESWWITD